MKSAAHVRESSLQQTMNESQIISIKMKLESLKRPKKYLNAAYHPYQNSLISKLAMLVKIILFYEKQPPVKAFTFAWL